MSTLLANQIDVEEVADTRSNMRVLENSKANQERWQKRQEEKFNLECKSLIKQLESHSIYWLDNRFYKLVSTLDCTGVFIEKYNEHANVVEAYNKMTGEYPWVSDTIKGKTPSELYSTLSDADLKSMVYHKPSSFLIQKGLDFEVIISEVQGEVSYQFISDSYETSLFTLNKNWSKVSISGLKKRLEHPTYQKDLGEVAISILDSWVSKDNKSPFTGQNLNDILSALFKLLTWNENIRVQFLTVDLKGIGIRQFKKLHEADVDFKPVFDLK